MDRPSFAGIDWASRKHALCVVDARGKVVTSGFYAHSEAGIQRLIAVMHERQTRRVAIERPDGLLVDRFVEAGLTVLPINSGALKAVRPRFEVGGGKTDSIDAFCLAELARTDAHRYRALLPDSDETRTLRALTRAREDLVDVRVHLGNQLRAQLEGFWPGAARIFHAVDIPIALAFLRLYPSPTDARELDEESLARFLVANRYGGFGRRSPADLLERLRSAPRGSVGSVEADGRRAAVLGSVRILTAIVAEIEELTSRVSDAVHAHPDGEIFLPLFRWRRSVITAALLVAEIGDDRARYRNSEALAAKAGVVPVVRGSGTKKAVLFRFACNKRLQRAVSNLADATRKHNPWAQTVYASARARGHNHPHALRVLGRAWLRVLWRCWQDRVPYDPAKHGALRRLEAAEARANGVPQ
jgi:transposase